MKLSFVVVTYQRGVLLQQCLASIYSQQELPTPFEIIVIDNGGDAVIEPPPRADVELRVERPGRNLGVTAGRNLAMALARGELFLMLDDDAEWETDRTVVRMCHLFEQEPRCAAIAARSLDPDGNLIVMEQPHPDKKHILNTHQPVEVPYFYAMGVALRAQVVAEVGGYPERFFYGMEEVDLSYRLLDAGYTILYDPAIAVHHFRSNLGRPITGIKYWKNNAVNKSRLAWRLLPLPYPLTVMLIWALAAVVRTRRPLVAFQIWREVWAERALLASERRPIKPETVAYIKRIGGRLLY